MLVFGGCLNKCCCSAKIWRRTIFNCYYKHENRMICGVRFSEIIISNSQSNRQCIEYSQKKVKLVLSEACVFKHNLERGFVSYYPRTLLNATSTIPITEIYTKKSRCENIITLTSKLCILIIFFNSVSVGCMTKRYQLEDSNLSSLIVRVWILVKIINI